MNYPEPRCLSHGGESHTVLEWSRLRNIPRGTINHRIYKGYPVAQCLGFEPLAATTCGVYVGNNQLTQFEPLTLIPVSWNPEVIDSRLIGSLAKDARMMAGRTQLQAANEMGISNRGLSRLETGKIAWTQSFVDRFNAMAAKWVKEANK